MARLVRKGCVANHSCVDLETSVAPYATLGGIWLSLICRHQYQWTWKLSLCPLPHRLGAFAMLIVRKQLSDTLTIRRIVTRAAGVALRPFLKGFLKAILALNALYGVSDVVLSATMPTKFAWRYFLLNDGIP